MFLLVDRLLGALDRAVSTYAKSPIKRQPKVIQEDQDVAVKAVDGKLVKQPVASWSGGYTIIDGSSRRIRYATSTLFIGAVATYSTMTGELWGYPIPAEFKPRTKFLALRSYSEVLKEVEKDGVEVYVKSPAGDYYNEEYPEEDVASELRTALETWALENIQDSVVVVDGPVYFAYPGLFTGSTPQIKAQRELLKRRIEALEQHELVLGIVKRIEHANLLTRCNEFLEQAEKWGVRAEGLPDVHIVESVARTLKMRTIVLGPFKAAYKSSRLEAHIYAPDKVFWYVYVEEPYLYRRVFRIEVLDNQYKQYSETAESLALHLASRLSTRGLPLYLEVVDKYAKKLSAATFLTIFNASIYKGITPTHDSYEEMRAVQAEVYG